jgi:hypothetical protein
MLRLFRHIRQRLFLEGRVSRYLGYAVGEIVLIVVGILIAVQIGEWREGLKNRNQENDLLLSINQNLKEEKGEIERDIEVLKKQITAMEMIIAYFDSGEIPSEEMERYFGQFFGYNILRSIRTAYETTKGAGLSITNPDLNRLIFRYYEMEQLRIHEYNAAVKERYETHMIPFVREHFKKFGFRRIGVPKDINDPKFREGLMGLVLIQDVLLRGTHRDYEELLVSNQELIDAIKIELEAM